MAALQVGAMHYGSGTGHRSHTCSASLTAESETQQKPWQMQIAEKKNVMPESSEPNLAAERVVWTPSNLKSPVWKYFGFWSVDSKNVEPQDKVVCKQYKLQLAYHFTTSNMGAHLENVHPNEHVMNWTHRDLQLNSHVLAQIFNHPHGIK